MFHIPSSSIATPSPAAMTAFCLSSPVLLPSTTSVTHSKTLPRTARVAKRARVEIRCYGSSDDDRQQQYPGEARRPGQITPGVQYDASIVSKFWDWEDHGRIHYLYRDTRDRHDHRSEDDGVNILMLPGFGAPADHYREVMDMGVKGRIFALDFLGQGKSVPLKGVEGVVDTEMWKHQVINFIRQVVGGKTYIVGNSVGGLIAAAVAADRGLGYGLVKGCVLLNPTPFFSVVPHPKVSPNLHNFIKPLLGFVKKNVLNRFWKNLTREETVSATLKLIYAQKEKVTEELVSSILEPANQPHSEASFMSLLLSPGLEDSFDQCVEEAFVKRGIPLSLIFGENDPWVGPLWGTRIKKRVENCDLVQLSPCGHCPHSECAEATRETIRRWVQSIEGTLDELGRARKPLLDTVEHLGSVNIIRKDGVPSNFVERVAIRNIGLTFIVASIATLLSFPEIGTLPMLP